MNPDSTLELILTPRQCEQLGEFVDRQRDRFTIFCVLAHSYVPAAGGSVLRLQFRAVDRKVAAKAVKILRSAEARCELLSEETGGRSSPTSLRSRSSRPL